MIKRTHLIKSNLKTDQAILLDYPTLALPEGGSNHFKFKVLSYNILADCYSKYFMFKYVRHGYLSFQYRSHKILEELKHSNSDIICLQEVDHIEDFYRP